MATHTSESAQRRRRRTAVPALVLPDGHVLRDSWEIFDFAMGGDGSEDEQDLRRCRCIGMCIDMCIGMWIDMCIGMWIDMCIDMCIDVCIDMCIGMCIDMCIDMCIGMCIGMCIDMCIGMCIDMHT